MPPRRAGVTREKKKGGKDRAQKKKAGAFFQDRGYRPVKKEI